MKKFSNLILLLPCRSLEDFPVDGSRAEAQCLLSAWTVLWHPELIATAQQMPRWQSASETVSSDQEAQQYHDDYIQQHYYDDDVGGLEHPGDFEFDPETFKERWQDSLVLMPTVSRSAVCAGFEKAASDVGANVVSDFNSRASLLSKLDISTDIGDELVSDFFALAYIRLQVELMTRKLRFSSDLDCERFDETVLAAAKAAHEGDSESATQHLQSAFDQLQEEKNQYYAVAADLVDMVLLSDSIRAESVEAELESSAPKSFVASGSTLRSLAEKAPNSMQILKERVADGSVSFVAGPENELPEDLLSMESVLGQLTQSLSTFEDVVGEKPTVFMRRRAGLHASLPGVLESLGFTGVIHATLDQGSIPKSYSSSLRWMGVDGGGVMAFGVPPLDASSDKSFLDLGVRIGGELDSAHVSTVFFARWPTQTCDSFEDLKNSLKYGDVLGEFTNASTYFENVYDPGYGDNYEADEYVSPWFEQSIASGSPRPISTFVDYWNNFYKLASAQSLVTMLHLQQKEVDASVLKQLAQLQQGIELNTNDWTSTADDSVANDLDTLIQSLGAQLHGYAFNPLLWKRRAWLKAGSPTKHPGAIRGDGAVKHATKKDSVVELSGFGQLLVDPSSQVEASKLREQPLVDDGESMLRNEQFEVRVDQDSGGIRSVQFYGERGTLLGQRLAVRRVDAKTKNVTYSKMVCDSLEVETISQIASQIRSSGRLVADDGKVLAKFTQTVGLQRGRNVIDVQVDFSGMEDLVLSKTDYIVSRLAWSDESAELFCDIQGGRHPVRHPVINAPHFVEVVEEKHRFALLTQGLPWHRRATRKMLDSILIAGGEQKRSFRFGIAVDSDSIMQQAVAEMSPLLRSDGESQSGDGNVDSDVESKWMLHLANKSIVTTSCLPLGDDDSEFDGLRIRFLETEGSSGTLKLYCRRELSSVAKESLDGEYLRDITLDSGSGKDASQYQIVEMSYAAREYFQLCLRWPRN